MGYSNWSDEAFRRVSSGRATAGAREIFRGERSVDPLMDPRNIRVREARDSEHHPRSVPILVAFDVTGSMGDIPTRFAQSLLGSLMRDLVEKGLVEDPQLCFAAVGDAVADRGPFQVGQFESGLEMDMWLTRIWLEAGGGDAPESYLLPHWFAARHTATDAWEKRRKKGYLFTIGDAPNKPLTADQIHRVFGYKPEGRVKDDEVLAAAQERWEVFHILVGRSGNFDGNARDQWTGYLGRRCVSLSKVDAICALLGVLLGLGEGRLSLKEARAQLEAAGLPEAEVNAALLASA